MNDTLSKTWRSMQAQWAGNPRLRWGGFAIIGILWLYMLLWGADATQAQHRRNAQWAADLAALKPLAGERDWPRRADDAGQQLEALRALRWPENEAGLAEAALQDWLRSTASKAGLAVRELAAARPAPTGAGALSEHGRPAPLPAEHGQVIRARLTAEFARMPLHGFLAELARHERVVVVERIAVRSATQPPLVDIDLRVVAAVPAPGDTR